MVSGRTENEGIACGFALTINKTRVIKDFRILNLMDKTQVWKHCTKYIAKETVGLLSTNLFHYYVSQNFLFNTCVLVLMY